MSCPRPWQSAILYFSLFSSSPSSFPKFECVTLKDFEESFERSPITHAITSVANAKILSEDQLVKVIERMLSLGADPNYVLEDFNEEETPVNMAIRHGYWKITELLLDCGAATDTWPWEDIQTSQQSKVPIHIFERLYRQGFFTLSHAILSQQPPEFLKRMLSLDTSYEWDCAQRGDSPLVTIVSNESFEYLELILEARPSMYDCRALMIAVLKISATRGCLGSSRLVECLLQRRPSRTEICANEGTALIFALCGGLGELVNHMAEVGLYLSGNLRTRRLIEVFKTFEEFAHIFTEYPSPFSYSCEGAAVQDGLDWLLLFASSEAVQSALDQGLKPFGKHLMIAAEYGRSDLLETLIEHGVDRRELDEQGCLQRACEHGNLETMKRLLDLGVKVNGNMTKTKLYTPYWVHRTPFQTAVEQGSVAMVEILIEHGANVDEPAGKVRGATALQLAAGAGRLALVRRLKDLGADLNAPASPVHGRTALEAAAEHGRLTTVQFLLSSGVSTENQHRRQYIRAVKFAAAEGHSVIEAILREHCQPWDDEDWRIYIAETLSDAADETDQADDTSWASTEDESDDGQSNDDGIELSEPDIVIQAPQLFPMNSVYPSSDRGGTEGAGGTFQIRESNMALPDFMNNFGVDGIDQTGSLAHLDMVDWVDETTQHYDIYRSPGVEPELSIIPFFSNGPHNVTAELSNQFHQGTALGIDGEARQDSASNLTVSGPDLDVVCAKDSSAVDTTVQHDYIWQLNPDILVPPSNIAASGSGIALDSCWLDPDAAFAEDPFAVDTVAFYNSFSQPTPDIPMSLSNIAASGSGSANNSRCRICGNVLEQCFCLSLPYMDGMDMDDEL
ncbi:uncharacterized protein E0L32_004346 [Thyridium curvatum]|uniref:Ankyrin n=1 Tax=Thyridium curvatum TaxID=1093900 RepID=A0A507BG15_9PEZI|nr:uncharacterized protein E0L32_004346 [Thyridium curvatum]TPX15648.1 hypothetical protein E0L32_004346 [Thyridium curvatum]